MSARYIWSRHLHFVSQLDIPSLASVLSRCRYGLILYCTLADAFLALSATSIVRIIVRTRFSCFRNWHYDYNPHCCDKSWKKNMPIASSVFPLQGGCACKAVRYQMEKPPLCIHACHCTRCQRETGVAYALNALVEAEYVKILSDVAPSGVSVPADSGIDQIIYRCPNCQTSVFGHYVRNTSLSYIRCGTLDRATDPRIDLRPDAQIHLQTKQPWVPLHPDIPRFDEFYKHEELWSQESKERLKILRIKRQQSSTAQESSKT